VLVAVKPAVVIPAQEPDSGIDLVYESHESISGHGWSTMGDERAMKTDRRERQEWVADVLFFVALVAIWLLY
jgi:hypothetical protein